MDMLRANAAAISAHKKWRVTSYSLSECIAEYSGKYSCNYEKVVAQFYKIYPECKGYIEGYIWDS